MSLQTSEANGANDTKRADDLNVWSCVSCRRRKVRCDRRHPCAPCTRNKTDCVFPVSGRIPRRAREAHYPKPPAQKQAELLGRLRRLEAMVGDLGTQVEHAATVDEGNHIIESSTSATSATSSEAGWADHKLALHSQSANANQRTGRDGAPSVSGMVNGNSESSGISDESGELMVDSNGDLVVGNRFWSVFCKEVEHIFEAVNGPGGSHHFDEDSSSSSRSNSDNQDHTSYYNFLLRSTSAGRQQEGSQQEDLHPLPSQMLFLWQIYMDNVDPFMKVLHVPTMTKVIREIRGSYHSLGHSMQALVLVISLAAITSLEDEEVRMNFNTDKDLLVARYRLGTEQAFERADFLNNPDIIVLQALSIYLGVLQHTGETRAAWFLTGVLIRIAVSMNLHRDVSDIGNSAPFEIEMRRRLWWQICLIDSRSADAQVFEYKLSERMFDTELPANADDADLYHAMSNPPLASQKWTDMTVFLIRCEIWKLSQGIQSVMASSCAFANDLKKRLESFQQSQARIEDIYLKHMNPNQALHSFVATSARLFLTKVGLILYTKQQWSDRTQLPPADTSQIDKLFMSSLSIIEYADALQNERGWSGWTWQLKGRLPPWHALRTVLTQLRRRPQGPISERAFSSAKKSFDNLPEEARRDSRYQELLVLTSAVERKREDELQHRNSGAPTNSQADLISAKASNLSEPLAQFGISEPASNWTPPPQVTFSGTLADDSNNPGLGDVPSLEMDWQTWDEMAADLEPSLDFWDMAGL